MSGYFSVVVIAELGRGLSFLLRVHLRIGGTTTTMTSVKRWGTASRN